MAKYDHDTVPLTRIYKLAGSEGSVAVDVPDKGVFTVGIKTPMNTDWSRVGGKEDADNLTCKKGGEGACESVDIVYGIRKLVIHGQMFDSPPENSSPLVRKSPSAGVQLVAVRNGNIISDTVVMRNVGYFQLSVPAGGNYTIRLKPGSWGERVYEEVEQIAQVDEWGMGYIVVEGKRREGMEEEIRGKIETANKADEVYREGEIGRGRLERGDGKDIIPPIHITKNTSCDNIPSIHVTKNPPCARFARALIAHSSQRRRRGGRRRNKGRIGNTWQRGQRWRAVEQNLQGV